MLDFNKKYEYHLKIHLRNNEVLNVAYLSDLTHADEMLTEFLNSGNDKSYVFVTTLKPIRPVALNLFDIQYIECI